MIIRKRKLFEMRKDLADMVGSEKEIDSKMDLIKERLKISMKGISQRELAERTGITEQSISRYLNGKRIPNLVDGAKIAKALNVSLDYLTGLTDVSESDKKGEISLQKALEYCEQARDSWKKFGEDELNNITNGDVHVSSFEALAFAARKAELYGFEIPNILRILTE